MTGKEVLDLARHIRSHVPEINGWKIDQDPMSGGLYWLKEGLDVAVYATPVWEGEDGLGVVGIDSYGEIRSEDIIHPYSLCGNLEVDVENYVTLMTTILTEIEKTLQE